MAGLVQDRNGGKRMDKQIGCMSGFLQIFDRQQILAGKRIHSTKRLPPSTGDQSLETMTSVNSPEFSAMPEKSQLLVPILDLKNETDKCSTKCKQIHRLSLDSKAAVNSKGTISPCNNNSVEGDEKQRRSPSVIARLMGLEPLSSSDSKNPLPVAKPTLRRSASESRVSRDLVHSKYIDGSNFQVKQPNQSQNRSAENSFRDGGSNVGNIDSASENWKPESSKTSSSQQRRSLFHSVEFFPEPNQMHGDLEKKMRMRGMDEQCNDLGTLKQILEVLQLKGLLQSSRPETIRHKQQNFVYDRNILSDESSIILMKPSKVDNQRSAIDSRGGARKYASEDSPTTAAVDRSRRSPVRGRNSSPNRIESNLKSCNSIVKQRPLSIEIQTRATDSSDSKRTTPINSPKLTPTRNGSVHHSKQRIIKSAVADDEASSISESTVTTPSTIDTERLKCEGYREERNPLLRCDKLLYNLERMNSSKTESPPILTTVLPSPVSVLDPGFDKDESSSPSYSIDYKATPAVDFEEESGSASILQTKLTEHEEFTSSDSDFIYISEILRSSKYLNEDSNVFFSIEKQLYNNTKDASKVSKRQRKLVFDVIVEILDKNRQLPPWKVVSFTDSGVSLKQIWSEFQKIREINAGDGLLELVSGVLKKDLVGISDWEDHPVEKSEAILDIERMIFKDLVSEVIGDLTEFPGRCWLLRTRRKLVF